MILPIFAFLVVAISPGRTDVVFTAEPCDRNTFGLKAIQGDGSRYKQCGPSSRVWIVPCAPQMKFDPVEKVCKEEEEQRKTDKFRSRRPVLTTVSPTEAEEFVFSTSRPKRPRIKTKGRKKTTTTMTPDTTTPLTAPPPRTSPTASVDEPHGNMPAFPPPGVVTEVTTIRPEYTVKYNGENMTEEELLRRLVDLVKAQKGAIEKEKKETEEKERKMAEERRREEERKEEERRRALVVAEKLRREEEQRRLAVERAEMQRRREEERRIAMERAEIERRREEEEQRLEKEKAEIKRKEEELRRLVAERAEMQRKREEEKRRMAAERKEMERIEEEQRRAAAEKKRLIEERRAEKERKEYERRLAKEKMEQRIREEEEERTKKQRILQEIQEEEERVRKEESVQKEREEFMKKEQERQAFNRLPSTVTAMPELGIIRFPPGPSSTVSPWMASENSWRPPVGVHPSEAPSLRTTAAPRLLGGCIPNGDCPFSYDGDQFCAHPEDPALYLQCTPMIGRRGRWTPRHCPPGLLFSTHLGRCEKDPYSAYNPQGRVVIPRLPEETNEVNWQGNREVPMAVTPLYPERAIQNTIDSFPQELLPVVRPIHPEDLFTQKPEADDYEELDLSKIHPLFPRVQPSFLNNFLPFSPLHDMPKREDDSIIGAVFKPFIKNVALRQTKNFLDRVLSDEELKEKEEKDRLRREGDGVN